MTTFSDRVEAQFTVPSGVTVSVSNGAQSAATAVTWPAGDYYHTEAGGVDSGLEALEDAINAAVQGYPTHAPAVTTALGSYGNFAAGAGWLFNITSGNDAGAFGGVTLTAANAPTYSNAGALGGIDLSVGFASTSYFDGGANFDVIATDDLIVAWVAKIAGTSVSYRSLFSKMAGAFASGWGIQSRSDAGITIAVGAVEATTGAAGLYQNEWHVGMAVIDRSTGKMRIATRGLTSLTTSISAEFAVAGSFTTAGTFRVGASTWVGADADAQVAGLYITEGTSVATGLSTNLSTAITNFANAVNSSFTVSMSTTTGLVTLSNSFWPSSIAFTSTDARDLLGYAYDFDYPLTAAQVTAALGGYGDFTSGAGYLCNESSGDLASAFGTPATLADASSPVYGSLGARGGSDKSIGYDSALDAFDGGNAFNVTTNDLIVVWVGKFSNTSATYRGIASRISGSIVDGWAITTRSTNSEGPQLDVQVSGGAGFQLWTGTAGYCLNEWHVGIACIDRSTGKARIGTYGLRSGTSTVSSETTVSGNFTSTTGTFRTGANTWIAGDTDFLMSALYVTTGTSVATGLSANLSAALSSFATYMKSQTGTQQAKGLWFPDCPLGLDGDPEQAPLVTDRRTTISPTKAAYALCGNSGYEHTGLVYSHVPRDRTWESEATYTNGSWEMFAKDCIMGLGHDWFTASSPLQFYWSNAGVLTLLGDAGNSGAGMSGWQVVDLRGINPKRSVGDWTGLFRIEIGTVVTDG